jgi:hypothetical protein|tara:strand:- start:1096 stop:1320 length:225 start_codon:yes stop_codon:yes gene_type:complete
MNNGFFKIGEKRFATDTLEEVDHEHQNIYELMCEEWDGYEENWIIKMQSVGLVKQDLTKKEYYQLFVLLTDGEW